MSINATSEQIKEGTALARECEVCVLLNMGPRHRYIYQAADDVDDTPVMHLSPRQILAHEERELATAFRTYYTQGGLCEKITMASHTSLMR